MLALSFALLAMATTNGCQTCRVYGCSCESTRARARWARVATAIPFEAGSSELNDEGQRILDRIVAALRTRTLVFHLRVIGHGDETQLSVEDQALAQRRAAAVEAALRDRGVPEAILAPPSDLLAIIETNTTRTPPTPRVVTLDLLTVRRSDEDAR